jgi:hypothetical protein
VRTLKPARRSVPTPGLPPDTLVESLGLVSPAELQPGPTITVGARLPLAKPTAVKKLTWIATPSNDLTEPVTALPGTAAAPAAEDSDCAKSAQRPAATRRRLLIPSLHILEV